MVSSKDSQQAKLRKHLPPSPRHSFDSSITSPFLHMQSSPITLQWQLLAYSSECSRESLIQAECLGRLYHIKLARVQPFWLWSNTCDMRIGNLFSEILNRILRRIVAITNSTYLSYSIPKQHSWELFSVVQLQVGIHRRIACCCPLYPSVISFFSTRFTWLPKWGKPWGMSASKSTFRPISWQSLSVETKELASRDCLFSIQRALPANWHHTWLYLSSIPMLLQAPNSSSLWAAVGSDSPAGGVVSSILALRIVCLQG